MTDTQQNLVLEHLRHIRARVDQIAEDVGEMKLRLSSLEHGVVSIKRDVTDGVDTDARQQVTLDKLSARIARIEHRLELITQ